MPIFENGTALAKGRTKLREREILEAFYIRQQQEGNRISVPSTSLSDKEVAFLQDG